MVYMYVNLYVAWILIVCQIQLRHTHMSTSTPKSNTDSPKWESCQENSAEHRPMQYLCDVTISLPHMSEIQDTG